MRSIDQVKQRHRIRTLGCIAVVLGAPVLFTVVLIVVWAINNRPPLIDFPKRTLPAVNAADDFHRAFLLSRQMKHRSPLSMPVPYEQANTDANYEACARDAVPMIAAVREGLAHQYEAPITDSNAPTPLYAEYREIARVLAGSAEHYNRTGRPAEAMAILLDGVEMAAKIPRGDGILGYLVAGAVQSICLYHVEELVPKLGDAALSEAGKRLDRIISEQVPLASIIRIDGEHTIKSWLSTLRDPKTPTNPLTSEFYETNRWLVDEDGSFGAGNLIAQGQQTPSLPLSKRLQLARFSLADKRAMLRENLAYFRAVADECDAGPYQPAIRTRVPDNLMMKAGAGMMQTWRRMYAGSSAALAIARTEIALASYRRSYGRYPDRLPLLLPSFMTAVPDDPFGGVRGKPLVYRPADDRQSYLLYSLGPDMVDNAGSSVGNYNQEGPGDIVAGKLFTRRRNRQ